MPCLVDATLYARSDEVEQYAWTAVGKVGNKTRWKGTGEHKGQTRTQISEPGSRKKAVPEQPKAKPKKSVEARASDRLDKMVAAGEISKGKAKAAKKKLTEREHRPKDFGFAEYEDARNEMRSSSFGTAKREKARLRMDEAWGKLKYATSSYAQENQGDLFNFSKSSVKKSVENYSSEDLGVYLRVNANLRKGTGADDPVVKGIDNLISRSKLPDDITVYRGLRAKHLGSNPEKLIGKTITDNGFLSTSLSHDKASTLFAHSEGGAVIELRAFKGQNGFMMEADSPQSPEEHEVLFPRGSSMKIISAEKKNGQWHIVAELQ